jgi:aminomethyltransferase
MTMTVWVIDRSASMGRLELTGRDRLRLLHNMSTQDFSKLAPGEGRVAVLTTALARVIDRVIAYARDESLLLVAHYPAIVRPWLHRHIFFNDQVRLRDASAEWGQLDVYGADAKAAATLLAPGAGGLSMHQMAEFPAGGGAAFVARTYPLLEDGFSVIAPMAALPTLRARLLAADGAREGDEAVYERLRVEAGLAGAHHELTEDYIPLEVGAWDAVSFNKGCYIGQEIIARMESRQKLAKALVKLHLATVPPLGAPISTADRNIGAITSATITDGGAAALGLVKLEYADPGTLVQVATGDGLSQAAEVVAAPLLQAGFATS